MKELVTFECFENLAKKHDARGLVNVGHCFHEDYGVCRNWCESVRYFEEAVKQGNAIGQFNYGICYHKGEGVCNDFVEAFEYFRLSADQGYGPALLDVGFCLQLGWDVPKSSRDARYFGLVVESGMAIDIDEARVRRIENPIHVLSLSCLSLGLTPMSLKNHEQSYFSRPNP
jgi:TPR repeat protein